LRERYSEFLDFPFHVASLCLGVQEPALHVAPTRQDSATDGDGLSPLHALDSEAPCQSDAFA